MRQDADPQPTVTLLDVARIAGVHVSTASRALDPEQSKLVSGRTAERVRRVAADLGYRPNLFARGLRNSKTMSVGVLLPDITNPFFPPIVRGVEDELGQAGYTVLLGNTDNDDRRELELVRSLLARRVDGFVLTSTHGPDALAPVIMSKRPAVMVNRAVSGLGIPQVVADNEAASRRIARHLLDLGHRRFAEIAGPAGLSTSTSRHSGLVHELELAGVALDKDLSVTPGAFSVEGGMAATRQLLEAGKKFTAVVAANDLLALGAMEVLVAEGLRIPEDVSVVGFNDVPFADWFAIPLTTMRVPGHEMGRRAAQILRTMMQGDRDVPQSTEVRAELVVRKSTGPAKTL